MKGFLFSAVVLSALAMGACSSYRVGGSDGAAVQSTVSSEGQATKPNNNPPIVSGPRYALQDPFQHIVEVCNRIEGWDLKTPQEKKAAQKLRDSSPTLKAFSEKLCGTGKSIPKDAETFNTEVCQKEFQAAAELEKKNPQENLVEGLKFYGQECEQALMNLPAHK